jgi:hypothetical protein
MLAAVTHIVRSAMKTMDAMRLGAAALLAALTLSLAGCYAYAPPPGPSTYDRAYSAMLGAMSDQGVSVTDANPTSGLITGQRGGITVIATVAPQADGTTKVEFRTRGDIAQDPQLIDRITRSYNARMGR